MKRTPVGASCAVVSGTIVLAFLSCPPLAWGQTALGATPAGAPAAGASRAPTGPGISAGTVSSARPLPGGLPTTAIPILTEASIWRSYVVWSTPAFKTADGVERPTLSENYNRGMTWETDPPPANWMAADFDDSSWGRWREMHLTDSLKTADGGGGSIPVYESGQYGVRKSAFIAAQCLRGAFNVTNPDYVRNLSLSIEYRGGVVAYINGREIGRGGLPGGKLTLDTPADVYPPQAFFREDGKAWEETGTVSCVPNDPEGLKQINTRIRKGRFDVPPFLLVKGSNVLALEMHRAAYPSADHSAGADGRDRIRPPPLGWGACGVVNVTLAGAGAVEPAIRRPGRFQVWNANVLTKVSVFGSTLVGRIGAGAQVYLQSFPMSWANPNDPVSPLRIVGCRNGTFTAQVVASCNMPIRGIRAVVRDLTHADGVGRIPAANCQVCYMQFAQNPPADLRDPAISLLDALHDKPPAVVGAWSEKPMTGTLNLTDHSSPGQSWSEAGAVCPVWLKVRVPADAAPGEYHGMFTLVADGYLPVAVPIRLTVSRFVLPNPTEFVCHSANPHSPDTLAIHYRRPPWSPEHLRLVEKTLDYMGQLGSKIVFLPLTVECVWFQNQQSLVAVGRLPNGSYKYDFKLLDTYLDLVQKHLKPRVVCLYVSDFSGKVPGAKESKFVTALAPGPGEVRPRPGAAPGGPVSPRPPAAGAPAAPSGLMPVPPYAPTPEAIGFWKELIGQVTERLQRRGLAGNVVLGMVWEQGNEAEDAVKLFQAAAPGMKLAQLAHYGGAKGACAGTPYGYCFSVWGNQSPVRSKIRFGGWDLPIVYAKHFRADPTIDLRPIAARAGLRFSFERAMLNPESTLGVGPIGMDFWNLPADPAQGRRTAGPLERAGASNLCMNTFSTAALLAPGPDGPISTARFEIYREGLQECEARAIIERALADENAPAVLGEALAQRCTAALAERDRAFAVVRVGERYAQGEGWRWFENSGWEDRAIRLFDCAADVIRVVGGKAK